MLVGDLMSTKLVTIELDDRLSVVKEIFDHMPIHHLRPLQNRPNFLGA